jgi:hypothetical protein
MATDIEQLCRNAITAILDADSGIQAITKRTTNNCIPFKTTSTPPDLPVLLLAFVAMNLVGGAGDNRRARYSLTAIAKGQGHDAVCNALIERVEIALSQPNLALQSIDGYVERTERRRVPPENVQSIPGRADIDVFLIVTK